MSIAASSLTSMLRTHGLNLSISHFDWVVVVPGIIGILAVVTAGWLADRKFGNYKVFQFGIVILFLGTLIFSIYIQIQDLAIPFSQQESVYCPQYYLLCGHKFVGDRDCMFYCYRFPIRVGSNA